MKSDLLNRKIVSGMCRSSRMSTEHTKCRISQVVRGLRVHHEVVILKPRKWWKYGGNFLFNNARNLKYLLSYSWILRSIVNLFWTSELYICRICYIYYINTEVCNLCGHWRDILVLRKHSSCSAFYRGNRGRRFSPKPVYICSRPQRCTSHKTVIFINKLTSVV